jgi:TPR repeat protein
MPLSDVYLAADRARDKGDLKLAVQLLRQGAAAGDAHCQNCLGTLVETGLGCRQSIREAIQWYRLAYRRDPKGPPATNIAGAYVKLRNGRAASFWFKRAIENGDGDAALDYAKHLLKSKTKIRHKDARVRELLKTCIRSRCSTQDSIEEAQRLLALKR